MKRFLPLVLLMGCQVVPPTPPAPPSIAPSLSPQSWTLLDSSASGDPTHPVSCAGYAWCIAIPSQGNSFNYLTDSFSGVNLAGKTLTLTFVVKAQPKTVYTPANGESGPMQFHLFLQRAGDNWTGSTGVYEYYRWWATGCQPYVLGSRDNQVVTLSCPLNYQSWSDVQGKTLNVDFVDALNNLSNFGITCGGVGGWGHGCYASPAAEVDLVSATVQ